MALTSCLNGAHYVFAQTNQTAVNQIQAANTAVEQAFNAVLDAEKNGANVTDLISQLNNATGILAQAENSYRTGDFNTATVQADNVLPIAQEVASAAQTAKQTASADGQNANLSTLAFTAIGAFVFIEALFLVWRWFKHRYIKNLPNAKSEVRSP